MTLKNDKEDQSKYYLSYPELPVRKNRDINVAEWAKIASSPKWRLGEGVVLRLIVCLTPTVSFDVFIGDYFIYFFLLTNLEVNNI